MGIQLAGCSAVVRSKVSVPDHNIQGASLTDADTINFNWPDMDLSIQAQNHQGSIGFVQLFLVPIIPVWSTDKKEQDSFYFTFWVNISPKDNTFTFDPGRVTLKFDDRTKVHVKKFIGPLEPYIGARSNWYGCGGRRYSGTSQRGIYGIAEEELKTPDGPISIPFSENSRGRCFLLGFDTNSSPDRSFILSIEGIEKKGLQYLIPEITFSKGADWDMLPVP